MTKNILKYYLYSFFSLFIIYDGTLTLYFQQKLGLSLVQVTVVAAVFALMVGLLEIPTGVIADRIGYKKTLLIGSICMFTAALGYAFARSVFQLLAVELIWALGFSFNSGTLDSFLFTMLKQNGDQDRFNSITGLGNALTFIGLALSSVVGGILARYDLELAVRYGFLPLVIPPLVAMTFTDAKVVRSDFGHFQHVRESFNYIFSQPKLRFIIFYVLILTVAFEAVFKFAQPYMHQIGIPVQFISFSFSCSYLLSASGAAMGQRLNTFLGEKKLFLLLYGALFITLVLLKVNVMFSILGLVILSPLFDGIHGPLTTGFINRHTKCSIRATVNSITNLSKSFVTAITLPVFGLLAEYSVSSVFLVNAAVVLIGLFVVRIWYRKIYYPQVQESSSYSKAA